MAMTDSIPELDRAGLRSFGVNTGCILAVLFGVVLPWLFNFGWPLWPWLVGGVLALWGLIAPTTLKPVYTGWMTLAVLISKVTTPIIMSITFYLVITPVGLLRRLFGKDSLSRDLNSERASYRVPSTANDPDHFERPF